MKNNIDFDMTNIFKYFITKQDIYQFLIFTDKFLNGPT